MKSFWFLSLLFIVSTLLNVASAQQVFKIGYFEAAPHSFVGEKSDATKPVGATIEYIEKYIAPEMQVKIQWVKLPFPRLMKALEIGSIDAANILTKTEQRELIFQYPSHQFCTFQPGAVVKKNFHLQQLQSTDELIGVNMVSFNEQYIHPFFQDEKLDIKYFSASEDNIFMPAIKMLDLGRIDLFITSTLESTRWAAMTLGLEDELRFMPVPSGPVAGYTVFSKQAAPGLLDKYEKALAKSGNRVVYAQLVEKYFIEYRFKYSYKWKDN